jgi:hypothetical protein
MKVYTFFKHDGSERAPSFDLVEFDDFDSAEAYALGLLDTRPQYRRVEICDGHSNPAVVRRAEL